ncbi:hypothetical protein F2Q70_00014470 [Brassica cretica]|uniref:GDSL esterase/lipase n=1 Tax=Brassica cretica TaxID=69181 RepID=A0A8S9I1F6_BRACR|nr:hypothetical protein F2Q70_00014470 [Brassica cretica]
MAVSTRRPGSMMVIANVSMFLALVVSGPIAVEAARAFFVFGDSLVDSGNNNYLVTTARADSPPYGIDFPSRRPTGRFSNGLNIPDLISEAIGNEESPLPYLSPELRGRRLLNGANFASAGIGILNDTGFQFRLHSLGVGRVLVTGAGPLGCAPAELARSSSSSGRCSAELQRASSLYDPQLTRMINELNRKIGKTVFIAANTNQMQIDFLTTPRRFGN